MTTAASTTATAMLIDRYLPLYDTTVVAHTVADADLAATWQALCRLDLAQVHSPVMDAAMAVRGLPDRLARLGGRPASAAPPSRLPLRGGPSLPGWLSLGEVAEREIALGAVGRFWTPVLEWYDVTGMTPEGFAAFAQPGWGKIAANFSLRPYGTPRTLVSYEARTLVTEPDDVRRFARYWTLVRPFVGHIMRAMLATVAADAVRRPA
ncbi:hypothetical protein LWC33_27285 [Pseudonocardia sp. RS11V-5]|uniref:hypothetical protein n=1 Tax=Pseudonocardia terrae TaxID=2905831 RepID=UPI001E3B1F50|nr:hypothetical protein [Pseudonocardia terrae]MCE3555146.1 hypothetical protein [Pseudonocardia terrae]